MALSDEVASRVLGELHQLTKHIDEQVVQISSVSLVVKQSAEAIKKNSEDAVKNAKESSRQAQLESAAHVQIVLAEAVKKTLNTVAGAVAVKSAVKWAIGGILLAGALAVSAGWVGYIKGKDVGAKTEWANTPEGHLAHDLADAGSLEALATCDERRGWKLENNICHPQMTPAGIYGWRIKKQ